MSGIKDILMQSVFSGECIRNETVMFIDKGEVRELLFPIGSILSVTSYDGETIYKEECDYEFVDGKIRVTENSAIPCITSEKFYNCPGSMLSTKRDGQVVETYCGEGCAMTDWQINVNYTHAEKWHGFTPPTHSEIYREFIDKLKKGEDVTVFFYGDSITHGASASFLHSYSPYQGTYPMLFTQTLADIFGYTVHYVSGELNGTPPVPTEDHIGGERGVITFVNTAVGGWTSSDGVNNVTAYVTEKINSYGCDLFLVGYGMNDVGVDPVQTCDNVKQIADAALKYAPDAAVVLISTMVPNPDSVGWYGNQPKQEAELEKLADSYVKDDIPCAVCRMTSVSLAVLDRKKFSDYSGNNINHPNDFFNRIYAQTLLQTVVGYENIG